MSESNLSVDKARCMATKVYRMAQVAVDFTGEFIKNF
jgi:hypothetical protein